MRLYELLGRAGPESLNGNSKSPQRAVKERSCRVERSAAP